MAEDRDCVVREDPMIMGPRIAIQNHHLLDRPNAWFCHALKVNVYGNGLTSRMGAMNDVDRPICKWFRR